MVQVANISHIVQRLTDKAGEVHEIEPGEHATIDIDKDNPHVEAKVNARLIEIGGSEKQAARAAREKSPVTAGAEKPTE
ncbi:hypothetical protein [Aureimonas sp. AU22]|uniref:hypothetical protein n=1 Tax=Aureimonas sp. AU22 TaxID=1638162 RepID=UPI0007820F47|nr:hypothetical protein [Aureimonas sp. AU22]